MAFVVVYDACVLYPAPLRDLLIRVGRTRVVRAHWSEEILDECFRSLMRQRPELDPERLERTRELMNKALPAAMVTGHMGLVASFSLPDLDDRHVLAAAVRAGAQAVVTFNLKDFPTVVLEPLGIEAKHPDDFVLESIELAPATIAAAVRVQAATLRNPPRSVDELLDLLIDQGLPQSVARLRELLA